MRAGIQAELAHDLPRAEQYLLKAASISQLYQPRWTLANYYFRQRKEAEFWRWFKLALERAYGDQKPLFQLAWEMRPDARYILGQLSGSSPQVRQAYLPFLVETGRLQDAGPAAERAVEVAGPAEARSLLSFVTAAIDTRHPSTALKTWNVLCAKRLLPCDPLDADSGKMVTNGGFARASLGGGFDWRLRLEDGVRISENPVGGFLRIEFTGRQRETCELLSQVAPVRPATAHALRFEARTGGLRNPSGVHWKVFDAESDRPIAATSPEWAGEEWHPLSVEFVTPAETRFVRLALFYERASGSARVAGEAVLRAVRAEEKR